MSMPTRRVAILVVPAPAFIGMLMREEASRVTRGVLPDDAEIIGARYDVTRDVWGIAFESATCEPVPLGAEWPEIVSPTFERVTAAHANEDGT